MAVAVFFSERSYLGDSKSETLLSVERRRSDYGYKEDDVVSLVYTAPANRGTVVEGDKRVVYPSQTSRATDSRRSSELLHAPTIRGDIFQSERLERAADGRAFPHEVVSDRTFVSGTMHLCPSGRATVHVTGRVRPSMHGERYSERAVHPRVSGSTGEKVRLTNLTATVSGSNRVVFGVEWTKGTAVFSSGGWCVSPTSFRGQNNLVYGETRGGGNPTSFPLALAMFFEADEEDKYDLGYYERPLHNTLYKGVRGNVTRRSWGALHHVWPADSETFEIRGSRDAVSLSLRSVPVPSPTTCVLTLRGMESLAGDTTADTLYLHSADGSATPFSTDASVSYSAGRASIIGTSVAAAAATAKIILPAGSTNTRLGKEKAAATITLRKEATAALLATKTITVTDSSGTSQKLTFNNTTTSNASGTIGIQGETLAQMAKSVVDSINALGSLAITASPATPSADSNGDYVVTLLQDATGAEGNTPIQHSFYQQRADTYLISVSSSFSGGAVKTFSLVDGNSENQIFTFDNTTTSNASGTIGIQGETLAQMAKSVVDSINALSSLAITASPATPSADSNGDYVVTLTQNAAGLSGNTVITNNYFNRDIVQYSSAFSGGTGSSGSLMTEALYKTLESAIFAGRLKGTLSSYTAGQDSFTLTQDSPGTLGNGKPYGASVTNGHIRYTQVAGVDSNGQASITLSSADRVGHTSIVPGLRPATATFTFSDKPNETSTISIVDSDGTVIVFEVDNENNGAAGSNVALNGISAAGGGATGTAADLTAKINAQSALDIVATNPAAGQVVLTQGTAGQAGNTTITTNNATHWDSVCSVNVPTRFSEGTNLSDGQTIVVDSTDGGRRTFRGMYTGTNGNRNTDGSIQFVVVSSSYVTTKDNLQAAIVSANGHSGRITASSVPGVTAYATFTFSDKPNETSTITLVDSDGTTVVFEVDNENNGVTGSNVALNGIAAAGGGATGTAADLTAKINAQSALDIVAKNPSPGKVVLLQGTDGTDGNTTITTNNATHWNSVCSVDVPSAFRNGMDSLKPGTIALRQVVGGAGSNKGITEGLSGTTFTSFSGGKGGGLVPGDHTYYAVAFADGRVCSNELQVTFTVADATWTRGD